MAQDVLCLGKGSMCTSEKSEIHCFVVKCPIDTSQGNQSKVSFKVCVSLLFLCLVDLSIGVSRILKSPTILGLQIISPYLFGKECGCIRSSLLLRTSLFAESWGYFVIAVHWLFKPVFLLMQIMGGQEMQSCMQLLDSWLYNKLFSILKEKQRIDRFVGSQQCLP